MGAACARQQMASPNRHFCQKYVDIDDIAKRHRDLVAYKLRVRQWAARAFLQKNEETLVVERLFFEQRWTGVADFIKNAFMV